MNLSDKHLSELRDSGLSDETIAAASVYSAEGKAIAKILGWQPRDQYWSQGLVFPFTLRSGEAYARVKLDWPRHDPSGKPIKYESPRSSGNHAYFPPGFWDSVATAGMLVITEGEKKALAVQQLGIPCIGLVGVWGWQEKRLRADNGRAFGERKLIADLQSIEWKGKQVVIGFDSDAVTNSAVRLAEARLAEVLTTAGATVRVARLRPEPNGDKNGCDDFIVRHGGDAFRKVLDEAKDAEKPPAPSPMDWARMFVAEEHTTKSGITLRWWRDEFHAWDGYRFRAIPESDLRGVLLQWLDDRGAEARPRLASEVLTCLASEVRVAFDVDQPVHLSDDRVAHPNYIAMRNGLFDLESIQKDQVILHPRSPRWFSPLCLPYDWNPDATCDVWMETLTTIFDGDEESINALGEFFGYVLTDATNMHAILLLQGPPRSGKSTILRVMQYVIGEDNCVAARLSQLAETFGLWPLVGKRLAVCPDAHLGGGDKAVAVLELLKSISGEDAQPIHRKHLPSITARLGVRFALAVNELPRLGDSANALLPRLVILNCPNSFVGKEDRHLEAKLKVEAPGILQFALDGLLRLHRNGGFTKPTKSREIELEFERLSSPVKAFISDCCVVQPGVETDRDWVWKAWKWWCMENGHHHGSKELLGTRLKMHIPSLDSRQPCEDGRRRRTYIGVSITQETEGKLNTFGTDD